MGDSYVELIATGSDESMLIVHALLEVTSDPEYDIASITFNFWHSLQLNLTKRLFILSPLESTMILLDHNHIDRILLKANLLYAHLSFSSVVCRLCHKFI
uniref:Uncharacterized protein n=1 Tax=Cucumis melo TaxID=3656 RepID=A0A9I9ELF9_CUCME